jgi:hypothetical protein
MKRLESDELIEVHIITINTFGQLDTSWGDIACNSKEDLLETISELMEYPGYEEVYNFSVRTEFMTQQEYTERLVGEIQ